MTRKTRTRFPSLMPASMFDPSQGPATSVNPVERFGQITSQWATHPGRMPGGSGSTGLSSGDSRGYSQMLGEQQEYLRLKALMDGRDAPNVEVGDVTSTAMPYSPTFDPSFQGSAVVGVGNPNAYGPADTPAIRGLQQAGKKKR